MERSGGCLPIQRSTPLRAQDASGNGRAETLHETSVDIAVLKGRKFSSPLARDLCGNSVAAERGQLVRALVRGSAHGLAVRAPPPNELTRLPTLHTLPITSTMKRHVFGFHFCWLLCLSSLAATQAFAAQENGPISLHPENPHYFLFRNRPTVLVASGEHYGAVLNRDFDFEKYLKTLQADGLNLTRTFSGAYVEPLGAFNIARNTLAPARDRFLCPWARTDTTGYANGGSKFDVTKWSEPYFQRLKTFVSEASKRGVVVEFTLFCPFYEEAQWKLSPQNAANNINGIGAVARTNVYTLDRNEGLLAVHDAMVRKIVSELRNFDNVMYEICNEPYFGGVTLDWQHHIADVIVEAEK